LKVFIFDSHKFDREALEKANATLRYELKFIETRLNKDTVQLARGCDVACVFVNDRVCAETIAALKGLGVKLIATRSAGFNHIDLKAAAAHAIAVVRVPEYSPHAVAEHAVALILTLNRKIHRAYLRVKELNFTLEGLVGFDLFGKTIGVIGTGRIGAVFAKIMNGFGAHVIAYDQVQDEKLVEAKLLRYASLDQLYKAADVISLHVPLNPQTKHIIDETALSKMKPGVIVINTGRGALIDTPALISALKKGVIGGAGLDVYEEEEGIFFEDLSEGVLQDDVLARLLTFPNVIITSHQAFLTNEALANIAATTFESIAQFASGKVLKYQVSLK
jgi:D-lactate dehydrogenase